MIPPISMRLILKVLSRGEGKVIFRNLREAGLRRTLRKHGARRESAHIRTFGIVVAPSLHHLIHFNQDFIPRQEWRRLTRREFADAPEATPFGVGIAARRDLALARVCTNPAGLAAKPVRYPTMEALQARATRIVDTGHIVADAFLGSPQVGPRAEGCHYGSKFLVDVLLVGLSAPILTPESATVGLNGARDAELLNQGHKEVDFIFYRARRRTASC